MCLAGFSVNVNIDVESELALLDRSPHLPDHYTRLSETASLWGNLPTPSGRPAAALLA